MCVSFKRDEFVILAGILIEELLEFFWGVVWVVVVLDEEGWDGMFVQRFDGEVVLFEPVY